MSASNEWAWLQYRENIDGPARWASEHVGLLYLIWQRFDADGEWPNAKPLQRELFGTEREFDVNELARAMPPQLGRFDTQSGKILLNPRALSFVPAAVPLLDCFASLVRVAVSRYADRSREPIIDSSEFEALLAIDARRASQLVEILNLDSWLLRPAGGGVDGTPQLHEIDDSVVRYVRDVQSLADYLDAQFKAWYPLPESLAGYEPPSDESAPFSEEPTARGPSWKPPSVEIAVVDAAAAIFLVHGHATAPLHEVARFIEGVSDHKVVILHEQPNQGQTLIEKFESNAAKAAHAVVLLTADDVGRAKAAVESATRFRGRQNVVLELGFLLGKLGRRHVTVLQDYNVEEPSDIAGLVYITLDEAGAWKAQLGRELMASGIDVDMNRPA